MEIVCAVVACKATETVEVIECAVGELFVVIPLCTEHRDLVKQGQQPVALKPYETRI